MQVIRRSRKVNRKDGQSTRCLCLLQEACSSNPEFQAAVDTGPCHFFPALLGLGRIRPWIHSSGCSPEVPSSDLHLPGIFASMFQMPSYRTPTKTATNCLTLEAPAFIHLGARSKVITPLWPLERRWKTRS
ncbi:hypothetical protein Y1Q_0007133 [Alligator mississippiensis]|uniref:Uncharacterized protein n=1 Tax=Alligator mississippiensis TaxID=8496 RepID=A0A151N5U4_ALLMI|nr:hypothetical protein Y1Q_0007133 [Alligator mississippiensis]